jgi:hypothetical protein
MPPGPAGAGLGWEGGRLKLRAAVHRAGRGRRGSRAPPIPAPAASRAACGGLRRRRGSKRRGPCGARRCRERAGGLRRERAGRAACGAWGGGRPFRGSIAAGREQAGWARGPALHMRSANSEGLLTSQGERAPIALSGERLPAPPLRPADRPLTASWAARCGTASSSCPSAWAAPSESAGAGGASRRRRRARPAGGGAAGRPP